MTESQFTSELSKRQADAKKQANTWQSYPRYGESSPYSMAVTLEGKSDTIPTAPTGAATCNECPAGQHIGLGPGKRYFHGE